jgi:hypothetical protein
MTGLGYRFLRVTYILLLAVWIKGEYKVHT